VTGQIAGNVQIEVGLAIHAEVHATAVLTKMGVGFFHALIFEVGFDIAGSRDAQACSVRPPSSPVERTQTLFGYTGRRTLPWRPLRAIPAQGLRARRVGSNVMADTTEPLDADGDHFSEVKRVFLLAIREPPHKRVDVLAEECGTKPLVRQEVGRLLDSETFTRHLTAS
jgi:hypothetical protein